MDILADLAGTRRLTGYRCFMHHLRSADPALAEQAQRGIDSDISANAVAHWLQARGVEVTDQVIRNHRGGRCSGCRTTSSPS